MPGLLGPRQGMLGGPHALRQVPKPGNPGQPSPMMSMGGGGPGGAAPGGYGSDEAALNQFGPGGLLWRQIAQGMINPNKGGHLSVLDPKYMAGFLTKDTASLLPTRYQNAFAAKNKKGK